MHASPIFTPSKHSSTTCCTQRATIAPDHTHVAAAARPSCGLHFIVHHSLLLVASRRFPAGRTAHVQRTCVRIRPKVPTSVRAYAYARRYLVRVARYYRTHVATTFKPLALHKPLSAAPSRSFFFTRICSGCVCSRHETVVVCERPKRRTSRDARGSYAVARHPRRPACRAAKSVSRVSERV